MVYEWRTYDLAPGKVAAAHRRFADHTCALFDKHGIQVIGFWQPPDAPEKLHYLCSYADGDARERAWAAFQADPEWKRVKAESEVDGPLTVGQASLRLAPTSYSALQ